MFPTIEQMNATATQLEREALRVRAEQQALHERDLAAIRRERRVRVGMPRLHLPRFGFRRVTA